MHNPTLFTLILLAATSLAIDFNGFATGIAAVSSIVGALNSQTTSNPTVSTTSSHDSSVATNSGYEAATKYLATGLSSTQALGEQSSYFKSLATATGSVPQPSYYSNLPSSVRAGLDAYGSGVSSAAKTAQTATATLLVFVNANGTLAGTNGTISGASGSVTGGSSGTAPGQSTMTSTSTTQSNQTSSMTTSTSSSSSSSGSPASSSSKAGAASQPTGVYKAAGAAAVGVLGLVALL